MAAVPDNRYVTGSVPAEMAEGITPGVEVAIPTGTVRQVVDEPVSGFQRIPLERPAHIPAGQPRLTDETVLMPRPAAPALPPQGVLRYDFPLLPGVQCSVSFQGDLTADHLEQLQDYIGVACKRLREQAVRVPQAVLDTSGKAPKPRKKDPMEKA